MDASIETTSPGRVAMEEVKAFEILARENSRMLNVYLHSLVNDAAAVDDLFQETMVVAWQRLDDFDLSRPFGPWLRGIASRLVMAYYRQRKLLPISLDDRVLSELGDSLESINLQAGDAWGDRIAALNGCMKGLPEKNHQAVRLRYFDVQSTERTAQRLSISIEACKKRLQRSRVMLADCLRRQGVLAMEASS